MRPLRSIFITGFFVLAAAGGLIFWMSRCSVVPIMMYHNVNDSDGFKPNTVSPENFEWQMAYLKSGGYRVISLDDLVRSIKGANPIPRKSVVITFDDAYEDNYTHAFPILRKYGFPAVIFVPSDLVGTDGHLTWDQIVQMSKSGITFGSHTRRHAYLPDLSEDDQKTEIFESKRQLERYLGAQVDYFAYPIGGFTERAKQFVQQAGYKGALTTNRGEDRLNRDVYELNRIRFSDKDNRADYLWIKLSGLYNLFRTLKSSH